jgi:hypothetical protein
MTYATNKFNSLPGSVQSAAITFGILLAALGPVLFILGQISLILGTGGIGKAITWLAGTLLPMLGTVFTTIIGLIMTPIGALVAAIVAIGTAVYFVIENWEPIKTFFSTLWEGITSGAQVVIDWLKEGWQGFADFFIGLWGAIWEPVKGFLNLMISGLNYLIQGLNKLHVTVPKWSPIAPGETWGINIPEIPKFHSGGTFKAPTVGGEGLALLRDGEKVTTPNSNNSTGGNVMLQVGVLVADDRGLKELERRLKVIRIGEGMRGAV